jgi:hypothetical protein
MANIKDIALGLLEGIIDRFWPLFEPLLKDVIKNVLLKPLKSLDDGRAYQVYLASAYAPTDVYLEEVVAKTETEIDDKVVALVKTVYEEEARDLGLELPNLDDD